MNYPTMEQVASADREQICRWHRFLSSPEGDDELLVINEIFKRFKEVGGFTPEISKKIGW